MPPAAPGSGFGSVTHDKTVRNGVEPRQTAAGSRPFGPKSLTRVGAGVRETGPLGGGGTGPTGPVGTFPGES